MTQTRANLGQEESAAGKGSACCDKLGPMARTRERTGSAQLSLHAHTQDVTCIPTSLVCTYTYIPTSDKTKTKPKQKQNSYLIRYTPLVFLLIPLSILAMPRVRLLKKANQSNFQELSDTGLLGVGWECLWVCLGIWKTLSLPFRSISTKPSAFRLVSNSVQCLA